MGHSVLPFSEHERLFEDSGDEKYPNGWDLLVSVIGLRVVYPSGQAKGGRNVTRQLWPYRTHSVRRSLGYSSPVPSVGDRPVPLTLTTE